MSTCTLQPSVALRRQLLGPVLAVMALALSVGIYETLVSVSARRCCLACEGCCNVCGSSCSSSLADQQPGRHAVPPHRFARRPTAMGAQLAVLPYLAKPLLCCAAPRMQAGALPGHWPHVTLALGQGFNLTAFALSLLLVFR